MPTKCPSNHWTLGMPLDIYPLKQGVPRWWCLLVRMTTFESIELIHLTGITCMCEVGLSNWFASQSVCLPVQCNFFSCRYRKVVYWGDPEHCWPLWKNIWLVNKDTGDGSSSIRCCKDGCGATGVATDSHGIPYGTLFQAEQQVPRCKYDARCGCVCYNMLAMLLNKHI